MPSANWRGATVLMFIAWTLALNIIPIALPINVDVTEKNEDAKTEKS